MRPTIAFLLSAVALFAQATVTLKPISLITTKKVIGGGRAVGLWTVTACNDSAVAMQLDRARIMAAAPSLHELPNDLAEDAVGRQSADQASSFLGQRGDALLSFASSGLAIGGLSTGADSIGYAGLALQGLAFIFKVAGQRAPNPQPYYSKLLPDLVALPPGGCSPAFYVFASLTKNPATIQAVIPRR